MAPIEGVERAGPGLQRKTAVCLNSLSSGAFQRSRPRSTAGPWPGPSSVGAGLSRRRWCAGVTELPDDSLAEAGQRVGRGEITEPHVETLDPACTERPEVVHEFGAGSDDRAGPEAPTGRRLDLLARARRGNERDLHLQRAPRLPGERSHLVQPVHDACMHVPPVRVGGDQAHGPFAGSADDDRNLAEGSRPLLRIVEVEVLTLIVERLSGP